MSKSFSTWQQAILWSAILGVSQLEAAAITNPSAKPSASSKAAPAGAAAKSQPVQTSVPPASQSVQQLHQQPTSQQDASHYHKKLLTVIENLITTIQANQIQKAYQEYTSEQFKKTSTFEEFDSFVKGNPEFLNSKNAFFGNIARKPKGVYSIEGTLIANNGDSVRMEFDMVMEKGEWRVIGVKVLPAEPVPPASSVPPAASLPPASSVSPAASLPPAASKEVKPNPE